MLTMTDQALTQPIPGVASPTLHRLILFTERLARLNGIGQIAIFLLYAAVVALVWGIALDSFPSGTVMGAFAGFFILVDWISLALLPRRGRSFGPIASGLVLFGGLRCVFSVLLALLATSPIVASTLLLGGHLALTGYALDSMWGEPFRLGVTRLTYRSPKLNGASPLRVLHLGDLHIERLTRREHKILSLIAELHPDLIVFTGDLLSYSYIDDPVAQSECRSFMSQLRAPLGVFAVPGTPLVDTEEALANVLGGLDNICVLRDSVVSLPTHPALQIVGLNCTHNPTLDGPNLERLMQGSSADGYRLLLYHTPDLMPEASRLGIDLMLSGHTHGGQVRLPLFGALFTGSVYWKRFEMGEYRQDHTTLYVSRGVGMEGKGMPRMRFLCEPEIELIELRGMPDAQEAGRDRPAAADRKSTLPRITFAQLRGVLPRPKNGDD
jgi:hypothetical protein